VKKFGKLLDVNKELWLLLSMFAIVAALNFVVASHRVLLGFYGLPTLFSAYFYGRRHAVLTAVASILMVLVLLQLNPLILQEHTDRIQVWLDLAIWAGILLLTAYGMGTLYEHKTRQYGELRETYDGVLMILCHFVSKDSYTQNHSYRVSVYATQIAQELDASPELVEDIRAAGLLHDIGKLEVSRQVLYKSAQLTDNEHREMAQHVNRGGDLVDMARGSLRRVVPLILAHHDSFNSSGELQPPAKEIPLGARIIAVADVYDALTSDRPYRKAMPPFEVRDYIVNKAGTSFDPIVVDAFDRTFSRGLLEVPELLV
jgi:HD-GYP domain-containing protein (c-di-GMP phosphodiesterase class II)